jgi:hypothetical protein
MHVGFLVVIPLFVFLVVVVAVRQFGVIVLMRVPVGAVLEVVAEPTVVMMRYVVMVVAMGNGWMRVRGSLAFPFGSLTGHECSS